MSHLTAKNIWLVGASTGIGEALAQSLAKEGAHLILSARSEEKIVALAESLAGGPHLAIAVDVTNMETVQRAWEHIMTQWGRVDILIYNAGSYDPMSGLAFDFQKADDMLDVNFRGALRILSYVLPDFISRRSGHIALVASVAGYRGLPNAIGYGASKAALLHLAENLYLDLKTSTIKVQVISPGFVDTRLTQKNNFEMPFMISPARAATYIQEGLLSDQFDIHFPKRFSLILKVLRCLPYRAYFYLAHKIK